MNIQIISIIIGILGGLGILIAGLGYAYSSWINGSNKYKEELISDLKNTIEVKTNEIKQLTDERAVLICSHQEQITKLQKDLSELTGRFEEQSKKLAEYKSILENRDPETLAALKDIKEGIQLLNAHQVTQEKDTKQVAKTLADNKE